ncbi:MAG TPA: hypothetical protein VFF49_05620 [Thermodesulfobacteriota bacterium]|nr:hypothetical protein [Thermodesulfobacteriota bacterium]
MSSSIFFNKNNHLLLVGYNDLSQLKRIYIIGLNDGDGTGSIDTW